MGTTSSNRRRAQEHVLGMLSNLHNVPIVIYETKLRDQEQLDPIIPKAARDKYEDHCRYVQSLSGGRELCEADQCSRARTVIASGVETLSCCHAGLYNNLVPIKHTGDTKAVLLYGQMRIAGADHEKRSLQNHAAVVRKLKLNSDQAAELRRLLEGCKTFTSDELRKIRDTLAWFEEWLFTMLDNEEELRRSVQRVSHDMATRLQGIIADADMLAATAARMTPDRVAALAHEVHAGTLALATVVQSIGEYLGEYRFQPSPLQPIIFEARKIYNAEAQRRGISIVIQLTKPPVLEMSRSYLQHAINNLLHNAVKYSYAGASDRQRFVQINGRPDADNYILSFENYGVGILQTEIEQGLLFGEKYQGKLTHGEFRTGSGMGLYFTKRVVERHHGKITVESNPVGDGAGGTSSPYLTKFIVSLPYRQARLE
jgi:signal transduction histidine kinase